MLRNKYPNYRICIYSQGKTSDFKELFSKEVFYNLNFSLNEPVDKTFHNLVSAKILVTAKSCFSYCAALLNTNTIYYMPNNRF